MATSSTAPTRAPQASPGQTLRHASLVLLGIAFLLSGYLVYASLAAGQAAGCDAGNCGVVLGSKWAKVFGVPVGLFGGATYVVLILLGFRPISAAQRGARTLATALALTIPAAALWFVALQAWVIHAFCPWCCTTHAIASTGAVLMLLAWKRDSGGITPAAGPTSRRAARGGARRPANAGPVWGAASALAVTAMAGFLTAQTLSPEPPRARPITATMDTRPSPATNSAANQAVPATPAPGSTANNPPPGATAVAAKDTSTPASATNATDHPPGGLAQSPGPAPTNAPPPGGTQARRLSLHEGRFQIDPHAYPVNGTPDAEHLVVMISDYTCPHCRAAYKILKEVRETFDARQLSYVMLPSHHGGDSLDLQLLMLTAWRLDPGLWSEVSADLYLERLPLKPDQVRQVLNQRLGPGRLDPALRETRPWIDTVFTLARELHGANKARTGSGSIPQFVIGPEIVVGSPADAADLFRLAEKNLGLVRREFPDLRLVRPEIDLGRVFAGTGPTASIAYTNAGASRLTVARATVPQGGRALRGLQAPVEPGATGVIDVAIAVPRNPGPFEQIVTLYSNSRTAEQLVTIKGQSWKPIRVEPAFLDLGRIDPDSPLPPPAVMRIDLEEPARIQAVTSQNSGFTTVLRELTAGSAYEILVSADRSLPPGPQQTTLMVALAKPVPPGWPENLAFAARALVEAAVSVAPQRLMVPAGALTADRHLQVLVRCNDDTAGFSVDDAGIEGGPAITPPQITRGTRTNEFLVRFTLPTGWTMPPAPVEPKLAIRTSHPRFPTLSVPLAMQPR